MSEKFCLKWNDFERNISAAFQDIRNEKEFFDVTLACDDDQLQAHKVILSACSPFFKEVLKRNPHQHPLLYLKGVSFKDMLAVLNFMYHGEVNVAQDDLNSFLQVAEDLRVKGLTQNTNTAERKLSKSPASNPTSQTNSSRRRSSSETSSPAVSNKRFRADTPAKPPPVVTEQPDTEDDIQEVVPVKSEPQSQAAHTQPGDPGTLAMYEDMSEGMVMEENNFEDASFTEEFDQTEFTDQSYLVQGSDGTSGLLGMNKIPCSVCYKLLHPRALKRHQEDVHGDNLAIQCDVCQHLFKNQRSLESHRRIAHGLRVGEVG